MCMWELKWWRQRESLQRVKGHCSWLQRPLETLDVLAAITLFTSVQIRNQDASGEQAINIINTIKDNPRLPISESVSHSQPYFLFHYIPLTSTNSQGSSSVSFYLINIRLQSHPMSLCLAGKPVGLKRTCRETKNVGQRMGKNKQCTE